MIEVLHRSLGNGYVQQVIQASAAKAAEHPGVAAATRQAAVDAGAEQHAHDEEVKAQVRDQLADLQATTFAATLVSAKDDTDHKAARWQFLNVLDRVDDPLVRHKMMAKFQQMTGVSLRDFIDKADWHGNRDQAQALDMISDDRDATEHALEKMNPTARAALATQANAWAEQVLAVTRTDDANDDDQAQKIARVLGPRTPEEIEMIRAAIRKNTHGDHTIYEELDKSLSKGNEDEAVAGLSGDPVHAAVIGVINAGDDVERIKEVLRGLTPAQLAEAAQRQWMLGPEWAAVRIAPGADRDEILKLSAGDRAAAEGIHIANMLKKRGDGMKTGDYGQIDAQSLHNYDVRKASNVLRELEQMPPEEIKAARTAWDRQAAATGGETFDELLKDRFNDGDTTDMRVAALLRGERAEDRAYALREGMRENDQKEIETALTSPDLSSTDPQKRAAALAEKQALAAKATELDASEQRGVAILTGRDTTKVDEHGVDQQLAAHYASYVETDRHSDNAFVEEQLAVTRDHDREKRKAEAADNEIGTTELWSEGKFSTATEYHRADSDKDRVAVLEGIKSNKGLMFDEAEFKAKYGKDMLEAPELAKFQNDALNAKAEGDERPLEEIERELAHDDLNAMELKIDNVREYGVKPERRPDLEHRLQVELYDKQHSDSLDNRETMREQYGGNAGTEELAREQLLVQDDMLRPAADPFGLGPRELKSGVSDAEFREIDQNLAQTLDVQREEKIKLGEHLGHIFATIAKIAALLTAQPELFALIDIASGLATMAIKKSVAGEAYDPADDTKLLAIDAVVDLATVGVARFAQMRKVGAIGGDAVEIGEKTAGELVEHGATQEAKAEIVDKGVQEVAGDAELADSAPRMPGEAADAAKTETALEGSATRVPEDPAEVSGDEWEVEATIDRSQSGYDLDAGMTSEPIDGPAMDAERFGKMKRAFERQGGVLAQDAEAQAYLEAREASAVTLNAKTMVLRPQPTASETFEEFIHTAQYRTGRATGANVTEMEIEAAEKLIRNRRQYGISPVETRQTIARLRRLRETLAKEQAPR